MIRLEAVRKRFGALEALRGVTLELRPGTVTALVGPNASGKTTLIKLILGLARHDSGALTLHGVATDPDGDYRRAIGYMPQSACFPDNLTVRDVIALVTAFRHDAARDEELVSSFRLGDVMDRPVRTLSGGTRQKVSAAIAFLFRPSLLILDEPTAGLDPLASGILKEKIRAVRAEGRTVLVTSHVSAELDTLCDDVAFLCDGDLRFTGTLAALLRETGQERLEPAIAALMRRNGHSANAGAGVASGALPASPATSAARGVAACVAAGVATGVATGPVATLSAERSA